MSTKPPHSRPPLSLSLTGVTDGPGFHQPGPTTLSLPAEVKYSVAFKLNRL